MDFDSTDDDTVETGPTGRSDQPSDAETTASGGRAVGSERSDDDVPADGEPSAGNREWTQGRAEHVQFEDALGAMDDDGTVLLVVGEGASTARSAVCRQLMGTNEHGRRRVVALSGEDHPPLEAHLPTGAPRDADHLQVVTNGFGTRNGASATSATPTPSVSSPSGSGADAVCDDIGAYGAAISTAVNTLEPDRGFEPGELRVCVDQLGPLFEETVEQDVVQFVHLLGHKVRRVDGKIHFHLPVPSGDPRVSLLASVCDILIDVRVDGGQPQQQWHIRNGPSSGWLPVPIDGGSDQE